MCEIGEEEDWLANHLSLGKDGLVSNPLNPVPLSLKHVEGIDKLRRSLGKELSNPLFAREKSSNLPHLLSIVKSIWPKTKTGCGGGSSGGNNDDDAEGRNNNKHNDILPKCPSAVLKPFVYSEGRTGRLIVDIVSCDGDVWYKISARNPKSLALVASGGGGYGKKSIVDHAMDYLQCAEENPCLFKPPRVVVIFTSGISHQVANELESMGVQVVGRRIEDTDLQAHPRIKVLQESDAQALQAPTTLNISEGPPDNNHIIDSSTLRFVNPSLEGVERLNLDISTLLAYLSNLCNGHAHINFKKKILSDQAEAERLRPQKPILDEVFQGRQLFCCETAHREFLSILSTVGGEEEKKRAAKFLKERVTVVPDQITDKGRMLTVSGNIKQRSIVIFCTGDAIQAVTVTSNSGFVRSARSQGVDFPAFVHESRALTEQKEMSPEHTLP